MITNGFKTISPGLLVSVRSASEALAALAGGADVIDVKEPDRGPLGAAETSTIREIVRAVHGGAPVTAAMGELLDVLELPPSRDPNGSPAHHVSNGDAIRSILPDGIALFKLGLAGCKRMPDWRSSWQTAINRLTNSKSIAHPVAVVYADWTTAASPTPDDVLSAAIQFGCPALLIDTWDKAAGSLFDIWPIDDLRGFLDRARQTRIAIVLAGSLSGDDFMTASRLNPDLLAVRGAACDSGRRGTVVTERVAELKSQLRAAHSGARVS